MASNRYYASATQEIFESYEWSMREALTSLDRMARSMALDLQFANVPSKDIQPLMQRYFAELWEQVAATEEIKNAKGKSKHMRVRPKRGGD